MTGTLHARPRPRDTTVLRAARRLAGTATPVTTPRSEGPAEARGDPGRGPQRVAVDRGRLSRSGIVPPGSARSRIVEEVRALRMALAPRLAHARDWRERVLLVTSARPGEGKTFTAVNLALAFAADPDRRVLLLDVDPAHFGASRLLGVPPAPGLADLLADEPLDPAEAFLRTDLGGLGFIAPGRAGGDFPDRLAGRRMAALLAGMLESDPGLVIVVDAPPVLAGSEALSLLGCCATVLFVVEAGRTPQRDVERAVVPLRERTEVVLVLNKATRDVGLGQYYADYHRRPPRSAGDRPGLLRRLLGRRATVAALAALTLAVPVLALARLDLVPRLEVATAFTDNLSFAPRGEEEPALVAEITAGLSMTDATSRTRLAADYTVSELVTLAGRREQELRQRLDGAFTGELVRDLFFLDADLSIGEESADATGEPEGTDFTVTGTRVTRYAGEISPYVRARLGAALEAELRSRLGRVEYDDPVLADATSRSLGLVLGSPRRRGLYGWAATASAERIDFERSRGDRARQVESRLIALDGELSPVDGLVLLAGAGWSELEDETLQGGEVRGPYARLGAEIAARAGLRLRGSWGLVYGEPDVRAGVEAELGPSTTAALHYRDRLVNRVALVAERIAARNPLERLGRGRRVEDPDFAELVPALDLDLGTTAAFRQRQLEVVLERTRGRTLLRAAGFAERRRFEDASAEDERRYGAELGIRHRASRRTDLQLLLEAQRVDFDRGERVDELGVELGWIRRLSRSLRLGIGYELALRTGDGAPDALANAVFARLTREF